MIPEYFKNFPEEPADLSASNAIARLIDGLGFRLYWAINELTEEDCEYRVCEGANSIHDILWHILGLVNWVYMNVYGEQMKRPESIIDQGVETLIALEKLRKSFIEMSDKDLEKLKLDNRSFWAYLNMPLADAVSHVGQVSILRRAAGNPNKIDEFFKRKG